MSSTRKLSSRLTQLLELFNRNDDWLIVINADPDAMASAMALKRIMSHRTGKVTIARINEISRPDNLAMIRYLRIPMLPLTDKLKDLIRILRWSIRSCITTPPLRASRFPSSSIITRLFLSIPWTPPMWTSGPSTAQ